MPVHKVKRFIDVIKCQFDSTDGARIRVKLLENHPGNAVNGLFKGDMCLTSECSYIDLKKGIAVSRNSIYIWKV